MSDDAVQSNADQGDGGATDSGLYDLDSVAPEIREALEPHLKAIEGNVTKRFQDAAEYRKGWAPYEELGIRDIQPDELGQLLEFAKLANNPQQFDEWLKAAATERGILQQETDDLELEEIEDLSPEKIQSLIAEQVAERVNPIQEKLQAQEQERLEQQASQEISSKLEEIRNENPNLPEGAEDVIVRLAYSYADEEGDPITKGFDEYKSLIGQGEKGLFEQKSQQPQTPEGAGAASTAPDAITSFGDPRLKAQALERMKH